MSTPIKVITLNLAHGRGRGWHQALLKRRHIESNLDLVTEVLVEQRADVVALQEADGPSVWSGRFDHVAYVAERSEMSYSARGRHVHRRRLNYGTALISRHSLQDVVTHTFASSPPTPSKGIVVGSIDWPHGERGKLDVASVHLDFSRRAVRRRQARELLELLSARGHPLVLMGDFNCGLAGSERTLRDLCRSLGLHAYRPRAAIPTFPTRRTRLDWILVSAELEFHEYVTLPNLLSDHRAVAAVLGFAGSASGRGGPREIAPI